jgi:hypothetical protein
MKQRKASSGVQTISSPLMRTGVGTAMLVTDYF